MSFSSCTPLWFAVELRQKTAFLISSTSCGSRFSKKRFPLLVFAFLILLISPRSEMVFILMMLMWKVVEKRSKTRENVMKTGEHAGSQHDNRAGAAAALWAAAFPRALRHALCGRSWRRFQKYFLHCTDVQKHISNINLLIFITLIELVSFNSLECIHITADTSLTERHAI